jgi:hypothetical protein
MCLKESLILENSVIICFAQKITLAVCLPNTDSFTPEWLPGHAKLANNWPPAVHCFSAASHLQIVPCGHELHETCIKLIGMRL